MSFQSKSHEIPILGLTLDKIGGQCQGITKKGARCQRTKNCSAHKNQPSTGGGEKHGRGDRGSGGPRLESLKTYLKSNLSMPSSFLLYTQMIQNLPYYKPPHFDPDVWMDHEVHIPDKKTNFHFRNVDFNTLGYGDATDRTNKQTWISVSYGKGIRRQTYKIYINIVEVGVEGFSLSGGLNAIPVTFTVYGQSTAVGFLAAVLSEEEKRQLYTVYVKKK